MTKITDPTLSTDAAVLAALARLEARLDRIERALPALDLLSAHAPALEKGLEMAKELPNMAAMLVDVVDEQADDAAAAGIDISERGRALLQALERLTSPEALSVLRSLLERVDIVQGLLDSGLLDPAPVSVVSRAGRALSEAAREPAAQAGPFSLLRALGDPDVARAAGFALRFAVRFGRSLATTPCPQLKPLPPGTTRQRTAPMSSHFPILVIGGGTAGLSVAARLSASPGAPPIGLVEPSDRHYYQPLWTMVGGGVVAKETTVRPEADYIPQGTTWLQDAVATFDPARRTVTTTSGKELTYEQLVVAAGIQLDWGKIKGLDGHLGRDGIVSNYSFDTVDSTWKALREFRGGNAVFTFPTPPIKCAGAPQKIMYLADDWLRKAGVRDKSRVIYAAASAGIFGVKRYAASLQKVVARKGIETHFRRELVEVRPGSKEAVFRHLDGGAELVLPYDLLHVVPPQSAPDFIKRSPLAGEGGWVAVHKHTLQHVKYPDVFSLGDCSSLPTSRTGAAIRKQAPVLVENLLAHRAGQPLTASYDGYASCPLVTGYGKLILAEFDYDGNPAESFPVDQSRERYSMYAMKLHALPELYWNGLLRGRA